MHITFRQLRLFLALSDTGSVSAAARLLHVTQPTASMQLKEITQAVGVPLYEVIGKKLHLTAAGQQLAQTARAIAKQWASFEQHVSDIKGLSVGRLKIAVVSTAAYFMPRLIGSFCKRYPTIDVDLEILNRDGVLQRLRHNLDDLSIMSMPPADLPLLSEVLLPNPIVVVAPTQHGVKASGSLTLQDLSAEPFIMREAGSGTRMAAQQFFDAHGFQPQIRLVLGSNEAVRESVAGGLGIGILSSHVLHGMSKTQGVKVLPVEGFPLPAAWYMVHHANKQLSPVATVFRQHALAEMQRAPMLKFHT